MFYTTSNSWKFSTTSNSCLQTGTLYLSVFTPTNPSLHPILGNTNSTPSLEPQLPSNSRCKISGAKGIFSLPLAAKKLQL